MIGGLRWNIAERVQAYTHPLWLFAVSAARLAVLVSSRAFTDYSTSGLENPLTHLLLASFFVVYFGRSPSRRRTILPATAP